MPRRKSTPAKKKQKQNGGSKRKEPEKKRIDWRSSMAKQILWYDLVNGVLDLDENATSGQEAWKFYSQLDEFQQVPIQQFLERLKDHQKAIGKHVSRASEEEALFRRDRELNPRQTHNKRGELVFDMTEAKELLRRDIENKAHEILTPAQLQATRIEYSPFDSTIFKYRIYQEVRYQKYIYYLNQKREKEILARKECFQGPPREEE